MPRIITTPSRQLQPQIIEHTLDSFPEDPAQTVVVIARENWPGTPDDTVARLTVTWDDGSSMSGGLPGGEIRDKDGNIVTQHIAQLRVPTAQGKDGREQKIAVNQCRVKLEILQPLRTALNAEVI